MVFFCDPEKIFYILCRKYGLSVTDFYGGSDMSEKLFLGGVTPHGFSTHLGEYAENKDYYTYILKGGAGTGKSSLMKKLADYFEDTENVTRYYCSSDPDSLDAVVLHSSKAVIIDGTAPHVFDPRFPGVSQKIVDLGVYWNDAMLRANKEKIIAVTQLNKSMLSAAANYSCALGKICADTRDCAEQFTDTCKLEAFAQRFCKKLFGKKRGRGGNTSIRQLSVMTRYGYMTLSETLEDYLDIYLLDDSCFFASDMFIELVAAQAARHGYDVGISPCLLFDGRVCEHLLIHELGVAIISSNQLTRLENRNASRINMSRFYDRQKMQLHKKRLRTNSALISELSAVSSDMLDGAKRVHDDIESFYIGAMDFAALDRVCANITADIISNSKQG